jgi:hypothetical protein
MHAMAMRIYRARRLAPNADTGSYNATEGHGRCRQDDASVTFLDMETMWSQTSSTRWQVNAEMKLRVQRPKAVGTAKALEVPPSLNFHLVVAIDSGPPCTTRPHATTAPTLRIAARDHGDVVAQTSALAVMADTANAIAPCFVSFHAVPGT